jgi:hypothetical protein
MCKHSLPMRHTNSKSREDDEKGTMFAHVVSFHLYTVPFSSSSRDLPFVCRVGRLCLHMLLFSFYICGDLYPQTKDSRQVPGR